MLLLVILFAILKNVFFSLLYLFQDHDMEARSIPGKLECRKKGYSEYWRSKKKNLKNQNEN